MTLKGKALTAKVDECFSALTKAMGDIGSDDVELIFKLLLARLSMRVMGGRVKVTQDEPTPAEWEGT